MQAQALNMQRLNMTKPVRAQRLRSSPVTSTAFLGVWNPTKDRQSKKLQLVKMIRPLDRGLNATVEEQEKVERLVQQLENINPTAKPIKSDLINGKWELLYTTNTYILGGKRPAILRPNGAFYQVIDAPKGRVQNIETAPYFNQISAQITPVSDTRVDVQFKKLILLGLIPLDAPDFMKGFLEMTYLDEEMRISRGDEGNLFVLRRVAA